MEAKTAAREIASHCLCRRVRALSRRITARYDEALRPTGLTVTQLTVLAAVERMGEVASVDLGAALDMEKSTVSRTVARMTCHGWLAASPGEANRRMLRLTDAGRLLLQAALPRWREVQRRVQEELGGEMVDTVLRAATL